MSKPKIIAIDGPASSGKSTLAERLAQQLGYLYLDTGAMYRAVTLAALNGGIGPDDEGRISRLAEEVVIDISPATERDGRQYDVSLDGEDVTWGIRSPRVDAHVSEVSTYPAVRAAMTRRQREIGSRGRVIMVGRDIGTVVMPDADLKIYLEASVEERAKRRYREARGRNEQVTLESVLDSLRARDQLDSTRSLAPLRPAEDAVTIDTTAMNIDEVVESALALLRALEMEDES